MSRALLSLSVVSLFVGLSAGCPPSLTCADGTTENNGTCVPANVVSCGAGTVLKDGACQPTTSCGPGTVLTDGACVPTSTLTCDTGTVANADGTACVPLCSSPLVLVGDACACPSGFVRNADACDPDPALCPALTAFNSATGHCETVAPPAPSDDEQNGGNPVTVTLPAVGGSVTIGGVLDPLPSGGPDIDTFVVDALAGTRLFVHVVGNGVAAPTFTMVDGGALRGNFRRSATALQSNRAERHVVIPVDATYLLQVSANDGHPGSADSAYTLVIDVESDATPTDVAADDAPHADGIDAIPAYRVTEAAIPAGDLVAARVSQTAGVEPVLWTVTSSGSFIEASTVGGSVRATLPQITGGLVLHVDYRSVTTAGAPQSSFSVVPGGVAVDGPTAADGPTIVDIGLRSAAPVGFDLLADHVDRLTAELPNDSSFDQIAGTLFDDTGTEVGVCATAFVDNHRAVQCRVLVATTGRYTLLLLTNAVQPHLVPNSQVRLTLEESTFTSTSIALAGGPSVSALTAPDPDPQGWAGPWTLVTATELMNLGVSSDTAVLTVFAAASFQTLAPPFSQQTAQLLEGSGDAILVQAFAGPGPGPAQLRLTPTASGLLEETEPDDDLATAFGLPPPAPPLVAPGVCSPLSTVATSGTSVVDFRLRPDSVPNGASCSSPFGGSSGDATWRIGPQPAGTTLSVTTAGSQLSVGFRVDSCAAQTCLEQALGAAQYTFTGLETSVFVVIDSDFFSADAVPVTFQLSTNPVVIGALGSAESSAVVDVYRFHAPSAGAVTFDLRGAPGNIGNVRAAFVDATGAQLAPTRVMRADASSDNSGPIFVPSAGDLFMVIDQVQVFGGTDLRYIVSTRFDANAVPPTPAPDCANPTDVTSQFFNAGPQALANVNVSIVTEGGFAPDPASCFGGFVDGVDTRFQTAFNVTIPPANRLDVTGFLSGSGGIAVLQGSCSGQCLASQLIDFNQPNLTVSNPDPNNEMTVTLAAFANTPGSSVFFNLTLTPDTCGLGETVCLDANTLGRCDTGLAFTTVTCAAGCATDPFELTASCTRVCGFDNAGNLIAPIDRCNGNVLERCAPDGSGYQPSQTCDVTCVETPPLTAECRFGLCASGTTTCDFVDTNGDLVPDTAVLSTCNQNESRLDRTSCANNTCADAQTCDSIALPGFSVPPGDDRACDMLSLSRIDSSGSYALPALQPPTDDFNNGNFHACPQSPGADLAWVIAARAPGVTVTITPTTPVVDPSVISLNGNVDCLTGGGVCLGQAPFGAGAVLSHTFAPGDTDLLLIVDSPAPFLPPEVDFTVVYSDDVAAPPAFCADPPTCANATFVHCAVSGTEQLTEHCAAGCNAAGDACEVPTVGETCQAPLVVTLDVGGAPSVLDVDLGAQADDNVGCAPGGDVVISIVMPADGFINVLAQTPSQSDLISLSLEAVCGDVASGVCVSSDTTPLGTGVQAQIPSGLETFWIFDGTVPVHLSFAYSLQ